MVRHETERFVDAVRSRIAAIGVEDDVGSALLTSDQRRSRRDGSSVSSPAVRQRRVHRPDAGHPYGRRSKAGERDRQFVIDPDDELASGDSLLGHRRDIPHHLRRESLRLKVSQPNVDQRRVAGLRHSSRAADSNWLVQFSESVHPHRHQRRVR